jgi:hypothetical protein
MWENVENKEGKIGEETTEFSRADIKLPNI